MSQPEHLNKRRKISVDMNQCKLLDFGSPKKRRPTPYGETLKHSFRSPCTDLKDHQQCSNGEGDDHAPSHQAGRDWEEIPPDHYDPHESMATFLEPSSTVPNATLTQQRVMEGVMAPTMLGEDFDIEASRHQISPEPSVPWSDLMKFSPANTAEPAESSDRAQSASDMPSATLLSSPNKQDVLSSQRRRRLSSGRLRCGSLQDEVFDDGVNLKQIPALSAAPSPTLEGEILPTASFKQRRMMLEEAENSPHRRKGLTTPASSSDDELAAIGVVKEQYKLRSTRSKSQIVGTEEPIDYSVRPEKAKKFSKLRKTSILASNASTTTPQKIRQICDMGFTPSSTQRALKQNSGDIAQTVNWLISNNIGKDELAPHDTPKKSAAHKSIQTSSFSDYDARQGITREQKEESRYAAELLLRSIEQGATREPTLLVHANNDEHSPMKDISSTLAQTRSPKVQVIIPKRSPKADTVGTSVTEDALNKGSRRRKTTSDLPGLETLEEQCVVLEEIRERKKGRGRPKKATNVPPSTESIIDVLGETAAMKQHVEKPQAIQPNLALPPKLRTDGLTATEGDGGHMYELEEIPKESAPFEAPEKIIPAPALQTPVSSTGNSSRSPMNKGNVPFRVGLSNRARIAPLLRTLKK